MQVNSPNVKYTDNEIQSKYTYRTTSVEKNESGSYVATPKETVYDFKVERKVPKTGMMLVGWGGNNGTTVTAGIIANRRGLVWDTREGSRAANYYGSVVMGSTMKLGKSRKSRILCCTTRGTSKETFEVILRTYAQKMT